jgi:hemerythrin-like domain-containing protein
MLRDKNLIPLSRQHQHALALCVRIDRATAARSADLADWQAEIQQLVEQEIEIHFAAEERHVFPAAERFEELRPIVEELKAQHQTLREDFRRAAARTLTDDDLKRFAAGLSAHIRKEERELFEGMQANINAVELEAIGVALEKDLATAASACSIPRR